MISLLLVFHVDFEVLYLDRFNHGSMGTYASMYDVRNFSLYLYDLPPFKCHKASVDYCSYSIKSLITSWVLFLTAR